MNNYNIVYSDSLYHHGILGQKWGVRRYQNEDGTLTDAGRRRYGDADPLEFEAEKKARLSNGLKTAAKITVGAAAVAGLSYYIYKNPEKAKQIAINGKNKVVTALKKAGNETVKAVEKSLKSSATAATNGAMTAAGAVAITKIDALIPDSNETNKIIKQTAKESIRATTNSLKNSTNSAINGVGRGSGSSSNSGSNSGQKTSSEIGAPSGKAVDRSSEAYRSLFSGVSDETKSTIKAMASQGYDIDQLQKYKELHHNAFYGKYYKAVIR